LSSSVRSRIQRCCATNLPPTSIRWPGSRMASRLGGETIGLDLRSVSLCPSACTNEDASG
jgi:hypothetical protein